MKKNLFKKVTKRVLLVLSLIIATIVVGVIGVNVFVMAVTSRRIISEEEASSKKDIDCIIVLGAGVKADGTPSLMLRDRLDKAAELYKAGVSDVILVSGDHRSQYYDEVNTMKNYLIENGVPSECKFMDHAGLSTYDSMYRVAHIFGVESAVIVTQKYHMYRALYDADSMGIDAYGVCAKEVTYNGQTYRDLREVAARLKDVGYCIIKPESEVSGEPISLEESGDVTND